MKTLLQAFAILTIAILTSASTLRAQDAPPPPPDDQSQGDQGDDQGASFQTFYDQLGDQGTWVQTDDYGYVFQPNVTDPDWAPYSDGHWVYTDVGWTWVSDEPWGWATYHYGRWANIDGTGWVWIPGYRWAPAWVSWRYGGGYCGWAPLPPETFIGAEYGDGGVSVGFGFHFGGDVDTNFNIGPGCYNFVRVGDMGEGNYRGHYLDRSRNYTVINNTTNITNININGGSRGDFRGVNVGGPGFAEVNAHARQHVQTVQLAAANQPGRSTLQGNSLAVYAPRVNPATVHQARPTQVAQTIAHPTFNRGDSITKPLAVTSTVRPAAPSAEAIQAAKTAQLHAPANARVATEKTVVKEPLNKPLTSLQPVAPVRQATSAVSPGASSVNPGAEHPAANSPFTGEPANKPASTYHPQSESNPGAVHPAANAPFTGEPANKPASTYHPQSESNPGAVHPAANSPFTGEPANKPAPTYHPQSVSNPGAVHPAANSPFTGEPANKPASTYHPQTEEKPAPTYHPQSESPAQTYHPQTEAKPAPTYHPQSEPPAQTYRPQTEEKPAPPVYHQQSEAPAPAYHPQSAPAPANHPAPAPAPSGQGNKPSGNSDNKNKQQGQ